MRLNPGWIQPAVAYSSTNGEYFVVCMYNINGDGSTYDIWGAYAAWHLSVYGP